MKKLMILGASYSQLPLITAAKKLGYHTVVTSISGDYPGFSIADTCCYADISKPDEVLAAARQYNIDGITTCAMDTGVRAIGLTCDTLNLAGISYKAATISANKYLSNRAFQDYQVPCAHSYQVHSHDELEISLQQLPLPIVIKAVDLMGSRGIYLATTCEEARTYYDKVLAESNEPYCLVEEFIDGILFGAECFIQNEKLCYLLPCGTDVYTNNGISTPVGHYVPLEYADIYYPQIHDALLQACRALGLNNTPFNCDFILRNGIVYLIEINGRAGATCLSEMVSIYYGCDYYEVICRAAMGEPVDSYFSLIDKTPTANMSKIFISSEDGLLKRIVNTNKPDAHLFDLSFNVACGDIVHKYKNGRDRLGQIIVTGDSLENCRKYLSKVSTHIHFEIEGPPHE